MLTTIGFLPNNSVVDSLLPFVPDEDIRKHLDYLQIPIVSHESPDQHITDTTDERMPRLPGSASVLFCTPVTEEMCNVAFYGYDDTEIFFHHDLFVFSTVLDTCRIVNDRRYVAVATFEKEIMVYDFLVDMPVLPQALLVGHADRVTCLKSKHDRLLSSSADKTIIRWDPNEMRLQEQTSYDIAIEKFDFEGNNLVFGAGTYVNINNESIALQYEMEQVRMKDNMVYIGDIEGNMAVYDVRNVARPLFLGGIHQNRILDICLANDWVVTASEDMNVSLWKLEGDGLKKKASHEQDVTVYSLGYNDLEPTEEVFAGNGDDFVFAIKLEEAGE